MKKRNIILIFIGLLIAGLGIYAFSPLLYDTKVSESLKEIQMPMADATNLNQEAQDEIKTLKEGIFTGLKGHDAKGTVKILEIDGKKYLRLEDNFEVTNGPDLYVYLGKDGRYNPKAEIARLKGNVGGQNYEIPASVDLNDNNEVWIWCKAFSVEFARAILK